jgi:DnaJ domain./Protein kinase domain.
MDIQTIINAKSPEEVFGKVADLATLKKEFRRLSILVHPDKNDGSVIAEQAFIRLVPLMEQAEYKMKNGTYGNPHAMPNSINIKSKRGEYYVVDLIKEGDLANVYCALNKNNLPVTVKVIRSPINNDLGKSEVSILRLIDEANKGLPALGHLPRLEDSFMLKEGSIQKNVNVFKGMDKHEGWHTVETIIQQNPDGIDLRDAAWMFNRLLGGILMAHQAGIVHAAIVPSHILLHLPSHQGVLIDWSYAVKTGSPAKAVSPEIERFIPPEVKKKEPLTFGTDLYMATKVLLELVGGENNLPAHPPSVRGLFRACQLAPNRRISDVNYVYDEFSKLLQILYGPRQFRPFTLKG